MRRAYVFRLRPTARQHVALVACVESHRELYNAALQERRDAWMYRRTRITYGDQSAQLTGIRAVRPDAAVWSFSSQQATLRRLNKAFAGFFGRVKMAKFGVRPGYPRFKGAARFDSVEWPKDGDGARWVPEQRRVYLQGIGQIKVEVHRQVQGRVKTIQIKRQGRRWMLVLSCDDVPANPLPATGRQAGIDVGIVRYATLSDGTCVENPRWARVAADQLAAAQSAWPELSNSRRTGFAAERRSLRGIARSPTSVRTFTTNKPVDWSSGMTCWWLRICRSPTCCGGLRP
jgi:putative transposase